MFRGRRLMAMRMHTHCLWTAERCEGAVPARLLPTRLVLGDEEVVHRDPSHEQATTRIRADGLLSPAHCTAVRGSTRRYNPQG
jgi:hypothetical protein